VLLATSTPDQPLPPSAPLLAHRLGLTAGAIDMTGACSGFVYALTLADAFVKTQGKAVLVVGANILSRRIDITDRASAVLFADAAGALLLGPGHHEPDEMETGVLGTNLRSDGAQYGLMSIPPGETTMRIHDGPGLFKAAIETMAVCAQRALQRSGLTIGQIDRFIPHQANARVFEPLCKLLDCPVEKMVRTVTDYGNASAATIPLSLSLTHMERPFQAQETVLLTAAGAGLTGGAVVLRF
jgi:3-oxoacyl-[acyl-carrier-protein] synthase-3